MDEAPRRAGLGLIRLEGRTAEHVWPYRQRYSGIVCRAEFILPPPTGLQHLAQAIRDRRRLVAGAVHEHMDEAPRRAGLGLICLEGRTAEHVWPYRQRYSGIVGPNLFGHHQQGCQHLAQAILDWRRLVAGAIHEHMDEAPAAQAWDSSAWKEERPDKFGPTGSATTASLGRIYSATTNRAASA